MDGKEHQAHFNGRTQPHQVLPHVLVARSAGIESHLCGWTSAGHLDGQLPVFTLFGVYLVGYSPRLSIHVCVIGRSVHGVSLDRQTLPASKKPANLTAPVFKTSTLVCIAECSRVYG